MRHFESYYKLPIKSKIIHVTYCAKDANKMCKYILLLHIGAGSRSSHTSGPLGNPLVLIGISWSKTRHWPRCRSHILGLGNSHQGMKLHDSFRGLHSISFYIKAIAQICTSLCQMQTVNGNGEHPVEALSCCIHIKYLHLDSWIVCKTNVAWVTNIDQSKFDNHFFHHWFCCRCWYV